MFAITAATQTKLLQRIRIVHGDAEA